MSSQRPITFNLDTEEAKANLIALINGIQVGTNRTVTISENLITEKQTSSIHVYFRQLAKVLNDAGLDMRQMLKKDIDIPWTEELVKEFLWKDIQEIAVGVKSTKKLTTKETTQVYDILNKHLGEKLNVHVPFPSNDFRR